MPYSRVYIPGDRLVECDICGFGYRRSEMRKGIFGTQKGRNVCPRDFDEKHPNDDKVGHRTEGKLEKIQ